VIRLQNIVGAFRDASDADVITSAAAAWMDLTADHETTCKLAETLDEDLPLVRRARGEVYAGSSGLPPEAKAAVEGLKDLLGAGDLLSHRGEIKELTTRIEDARRIASDDAAARLTKELEANVAEIRNRFADMDHGKLDEALRQLDNLKPPEDPSTAPLGDLLARIELVPLRANAATRVLEELQAAGNLARVYVAELVSDPITTEDELDVALGRIRQAAAAELADGNQVRLQ
jgi:hypothetical protein